MNFTTRGLTTICIIQQMPCFKFCPSPNAMGYIITAMAGSFSSLLECFGFSFKIQAKCHKLGLS